jgi:hypothetical protein
MEDPAGAYTGGGAVSYRLCILRARIDLVRAELAGRDPASPEDLARVLLGDFSEDRS